MQPIFLVGVPRSGTTLLATMLCSHSRLSCGPETHFFDGLSAEMEETLCSDVSWPEAAINYLFSIPHADSLVPMNYDISRNELAEYLQPAERNITSVASALPEIFMKKIGKLRWVEKTPDHLICAKRIRQHFPNAPIVRIVRDPRDVALSLNAVAWGPQTFLKAILFWRKYHHASKAFFETDNLFCTVRYEELLASPEKELARLCDFIGESFEHGMLDTSQAAGFVNKTNEPWKEKVADKVDKSRANAWKNRLTEEQRRQANAIIGNYTDEREALAKTLQYVKVEGLEHISSYIDLYVLRTLIAESKRFWPASADEQPTRTLVLGQPEPTIATRFIKPVLKALGLKEVGKKIWYRWLLR